MTKPLKHPTRTVAAIVAEAFERAAEAQRVGLYPLRQYADDPVRYVHERLRVEQLLPHQERILRAMADGMAGRPGSDGRPLSPWIVVRSGQKIGKTALACMIALWWYECFGESRVFMFAAIVAQTRNVLWSELRKIVRRARLAGSDIDGKMSDNPVTGFVSFDGAREIRGFAGRDIESRAGISGRQLWIVDEASHMTDREAEAIVGNAMGGGAAHFWISNPTRNVGPFYDAFHKRKASFQTFHVDAEDVARWQHDTGIRVPFTTDLDMVEMARENYREDSLFWYWRVKGEFVRNEEGHAIAMASIEAARARWHSGEGGDGLLTIGYDCAGPGSGGDEHCWAIVRGTRCLKIMRARGLSEEAALERTYGIIEAHREGDELPRLIVDSEGPIGGSLYGRFRAQAEERRSKDLHHMFEVFGVKSSSPNVRDKEKFERIRDELVWALGQWVLTGAIPPDDQLDLELHAPTWKSSPAGKLKATPKPELRDELGHSPDSFDALALAVHQPMAWRAEAPPPAAPFPRTQNPYETHRVFDPYKGMDAFIPAAHRR